MWEQLLYITKAVLSRIYFRKKEEEELPMDEAELWPFKRPNLWSQANDWRSHLWDAGLCCEFHWHVPAKSCLPALHANWWVLPHFLLFLHQNQDRTIFSSSTISAGFYCKSISPRNKMCLKYQEWTTNGFMGLINCFFLEIIEFAMRNIGIIFSATSANGEYRVIGTAMYCPLCTKLRQGIYT